MNSDCSFPSTTTTRQRACGLNLCGLNLCGLSLCGLSLCGLSLCGMITLLFAGCDSGPPSENGLGQKKTQTVVVATAVAQQVIDYVDLVGRTEANKLVEIRSRVSGFLLKRHFTDGQRVKKGDVLFTIEPDQYQAIHNQSLAQIKVAEAQLKLEEKTFARIEKLLENKAVSRQEYEENQAKVETARAQLYAAQADAARTQLDVSYTTIASPIDGRVDRRLVDEGNYVTGGALGGTVLTTVINDHPIKATANVDENTILTVRRLKREIGGDGFEEADRIEEQNILCHMQLADEEGYPHIGKVEYAEIQVNAGTGTSQVRSVFDNQDALIRVGMFVRMRIPVTDEYDAVLVPDRAIATDQATRFVYVVDDEGKVAQTTITVGERQEGGMRVVRDGLKAGQQIVIEGLSLIRDGMKVNPKTEDEPAKLVQD